jgi:transcription elongation factor GreB
VLTSLPVSKAFTKETETEEELPEEPGEPLPAGAKNYITPAGFQRLRDELQHLLRVERPKVVETVSWAASNGDRSENGDYIYGKKRLREIDRRIRFLSKRLEISQVVDPAAQKDRTRVFFGATVTYANSRDEEKTVTIVGVDEADLDDGKVSWVAPIARALRGAEVGETVELRIPAGVEMLEVIAIRYEGTASPR